MFPNLIGINLLIGSFIGSLVLLSVPLVLMSAMNTLLISIVKYKNDQSSDSKSGFVLFISTIGSVFGVIFTALFLIPNFTKINELPKYKLGGDKKLSSSFFSEDINIKELDYYFTNSISRASKTMSECRQIKQNTKKTGTNN